jgi:hypothetical protein
VTNLILQQLRARGVVLGDVLPFAQAGHACNLAAQLGRIVMLVEALNSGRYWVVSNEDAARMEAAGFQVHRGELDRRTAQ